MVAVVGVAVGGGEGGEEVDFCWAESSPPQILAEEEEGEMGVKLGDVLGSGGVRVGVRGDAGVLGVLGEAVALRGLHWGRVEGGI